MALIHTYSLLALFCGLVPVKQEATVLPEPSCNNILIISGNTNINSFELYYQLKDMQLIVLHDEKGVPFDDTKVHQVNLPLKSFEMDNEFMRSDFLDLVKADIYPDITIGVTQKDLATLSQSNNNLNISISLAGVPKSISIFCQENSCSSGKVVLSGSKVLKLSDFNIYPHNYFGIISIRNDILINFEFIISP